MFMETWRVPITWDSLKNLENHTQIVDTEEFTAVVCFVWSFSHVFFQHGLNQSTDLVEFLGTPIRQGIPFLMFADGNADVRRPSALAIGSSKIISSLDLCSSAMFQNHFKSN
jgi:hypothetical protein